MNKDFLKVVLDENVDCVKFWQHDLNGGVGKPNLQLNCDVFYNDGSIENLYFHYGKWRFSSESCNLSYKP